MYVPSLLSMTALRVPRRRREVTSAPPFVSGFPDASRSWTVIVDVLEPSAGIEVGSAVICEVAPDGGTGA